MKIIIKIFLITINLFFAQKNFKNKNIDIEICNFNLSSCKLYEKISIELKKKLYLKKNLT